jgi:hypothetical protein
MVIAGVNPVEHRTVDGDSKGLARHTFDNNVERLSASRNLQIHNVRFDEPMPFKNVPRYNPIDQNDLVTHLHPSP